METISYISFSIFRTSKMYFEQWLRQMLVWDPRKRGGGLGETSSHNGPVQKRPKCFTLLDSILEMKVSTPGVIKHPIFVWLRYFDFFDNFIVRRTHLSKGFVLNFVVLLLLTIAFYLSWGRHQYRGIPQYLFSLTCDWRMKFPYLFLCNQTCVGQWRVSF